MKRVLLLLAALTLSASLAHADVCAPSKVTDLTVLSTGLRSVALTFTDPGDDCNTGTATSYEIRYAAGAITESNYYLASVLMTGGPDGANGSSDCADNYGTLGCSSVYYFAITFTDDAGNRSPVSNSPTGTTPSCSATHIAICN